MHKKKWKETLVGQLLENDMVRYAVSGGIVTLTSAAGYFLLLHAGLLYTAANMASLVLGKAAGYFLNKFWVYRCACDNWIQAAAELLRYIAARGFTGLLDFFGVIFLVEYAGMGERISKVLLMGAVIILNYVLGKKAVFIQHKLGGRKI